MPRPPPLVLSDGHAARHKDVRNGMEKSALVLGRRRSVSLEAEK